MRIFAFLLGLLSCFVLQSCIGPVRPGLSSTNIEKEYPFDDPGAVIVYGKLGWEVGGSNFLVEQSSEGVNYSVQRLDSGYFAMEIIPGFYKLQPYSPRLKRKHEGWDAVGVSPRDNPTRVQYEEDSETIGLNFICKAGEVLYLGHIDKKKEFMESEDKKEAADRWMESRYPKFKKVLSKKYLAK